MTKGLLVRATFLLTLSFMLLLPLLHSSAQSYVTISGKVVDGDWDGIEGVWVRAESVGQQLTQTATDRNGFFTLRVQAGGEVIKKAYTLWYSKKGFSDYAEVVNLGAEDVNLGQRVMQPDLVDLDLSSIPTEPTVKAGDAAEIPFTVKNFENQSVIVTFKLKAPTGWEARIVDASGSVTTLSLSAAGNISSSASLDIVYDVPLNASGYYPISLQAHQNSSVSLSYMVNVEPLKDEELVYASAKSMVASDDSTVGFDITLSNPSQSSLDVALSMESPKGWNYTTVVGSSSVSTMSLKAEESRSLKAMVSIPAGTSDGTYNLVFKADFGSLTVRIPLQVTVNVSEVTFSDSDFLLVSYPHLVSAPNEEVEFSLELMNPYDTIQYIDLEVEAPQGWTYVVMGGTSRILGLSLMPGRSVSVELYVDAPSEAEDGTYLIPFTMKSERINVTIPLKVTVSRDIAYAGNQIELTTTNPYQEAYGGRTVSYGLYVENNDDEPDLVDLTLTGLQSGFTAAFQDSKGQDIRRIYVVNGTRASFTLTVTVPEDAPISTVPMNVTATGSKGSDVLPLTLEVAGKYSISVKTTNLFTTVTIGSKQSFIITANNDGTQDLTAVTVEVPSAALPSGLTITSTPTSLAVLRRGEQASFTLQIESTTDLSVGTYPITFTLVSSQVSSAQSILTVQAVQGSNIVWIGIGAVVVGIVILGLVFRRVGRR